MDIKQQILDVATDQFMQLGIRSVSMDDLSSSLGISKKTLYQNVENKRDLVFQAISRHIKLEKELIQDIQHNATDAIDELVQISRYVTSMFRNIHPTLLHDLQKYYKNSWKLVIGLQSDFIRECIRSNLKRGLEEGYYRPEIDADIISGLYVAKARAIVDNSIFPISTYAGDNLIRQHTLYHLHGIISKKGEEHLRDFQIFKD